jgi:hypothetical protein
MLSDLFNRAPLTIKLVAAKLDFRLAAVRELEP